MPLKYKKKDGSKFSKPVDLKRDDVVNVQRKKWRFSKEQTKSSDSDSKTKSHFGTWESWDTWDKNIPLKKRIRNAQRRKKDEDTSNDSRFQSGSTQIFTYSSSDSWQDSSCAQDDKAFHKKFDQFKNDCQFKQFRKWKRYHDWIAFCKKNNNKTDDWELFKKWEGSWLKHHDPKKYKEEFLKWKEDPQEEECSLWGDFGKWNEEKPKVNRRARKSTKVTGYVKKTGNKKDKKK